MLNLFLALAISAPVLYSLEAWESPTSAGPDDLLQMSGAGLGDAERVVYREIDDAVSEAERPAEIPRQSTAHAGTAEIVSRKGLPYALTALLPKGIRARKPYALWVVTSKNIWSNAVKINNPRPLWISPGTVFSTMRVAGLPRKIKLVGRNLAPIESGLVSVRLNGPQLLNLHTRLDPSSELADYAVSFELPSFIKPGRYSLEYSRGSNVWIPLRDQLLSVIDDPRKPRIFNVGASRFGNCRADDDIDDVECVRRAIQAAENAGGGVVAFGSGRWLLSADGVARLSNAEGLLVPKSVSLAGAGDHETVVERTSRGTAPLTPGFTLVGKNSVTGIHFRDREAYRAGEPAAPMLKLGRNYDALSLNSPGSRRVSDIVIAQNIFDRTHPAVAGGGLPIDRLYITHNEFGAYDFGLIVRGNRFNRSDRFEINDAVIVSNIFKPGKYLDVSIRQGAIASQLGAADRMDFSDNVADGESRKFLDQADDAPGWRAAFFWNLSGKSERLLISKNIAACTGDKDGDGEAIALDNDGNAFAFGEAEPVKEASSQSLVLNALPKSIQDGRGVQSDYYLGHRIQVVAGPGVGQSRRIDSYRLHKETNELRLDVSPSWSVVPDQTSRVIIGRQFWQVYIVANSVDNRMPRCLKSNRTDAKSGVIGIWAQSADSVIAGNIQHDSDGILVNQNYSAEDRACKDCEPSAFVQSSLEIRHNTIIGEYDWDSDCSHSGIYLANSASPTLGSEPPTMGFGMSIDHNRINRADGLRGGAIVVPLTWHQGPPPHDWPIINNLLIHHNQIEDLTGPPPKHKCDNVQLSRIGINLYQADMVHGTVLYANSCRNVTTKLHDNARNTVRVCPSPIADSCECSENALDNATSR